MTAQHDASTAAPELLRELVAANRILAAQQVLDCFGHVSVRHDAEPSRFLIARMSGFLGGDGAPVFEIRDVVGETSDLLVRNQTLGSALARVLGSAAVALMPGHGSVVVGTSLKQAVFRAIYAQTNAQLQWQASLLGTPTFLSAGEADRAAAANDEHLDRPWALWLRALGDEGRAGDRPPTAGRD